MWRKIETKSTRLLFVGLALGIADGSGDPAAIRLWADRLTELDPEWNPGDLFIVIQRSARPAWSGCGAACAC